MADLGTLGGSYSVAHGINNAGQVVGWSYLHGTSLPTHAFLYSGGGMTDLGTLGGSSSMGDDINNEGQIVGYSQLPGNNRIAAFLYSGGTMIDLNSFLAPTSGWQLEEAYAINDLGQVVGYGTIAGETHAFLLDTTPEPSSAALLGAGATLLALMRKRLQGL